MFHTCLEIHSTKYIESKTFIFERVCAFVCVHMKDFHLEYISVVVLLRQFFN